MPAHLTSRRFVRDKKTRWQVRVTDRIASALITIGGIGTIVSVSLVLVLLLWVVWPLFRSASLGTPELEKAPWAGSAPLAMATDEYRVLGWALYGNGKLQVFRVDTGAVLSSRDLAEGRQITAVSHADLEESAAAPPDNLAIALDNGSVRLGRIGFATTFLDRNKLPPELKDLRVGQIGVLEAGAVERTPEQQFRIHRVTATLGPPVSLGNSPVRLLEHLPQTGGPMLAVATQDGKVRFGTLRAKRDVLTQKTTLQPKLESVAIKDHGEAKPWRLLIPARGDNLYVLWQDGRLERFDTRQAGPPPIAETLQLLDGGATAVGTARFLLGRETLIVGDNRGALRAWFRVRNDAAKTPDKSWLLPVHKLPSRDAAVTALGMSPRARMVSAGYSDGYVQVCYVTSEKRLADAQCFSGQPVLWTTLTPKSPLVPGGPARQLGGGLLAASAADLWQAEFKPSHPEATFGTLFKPTWYESYDRPEHVWQSSAADVSVETKLGLWPLVFGTAKATFYSMLVGAPLALLAAIYTSEFLSRRIRPKVKSLVEMMASLPSVVLGFVAALVLAPYIEKFVPAVLAGVFTVPFALLVGASLWQQVPRGRALSLVSLRLPLTVLMLALGVFSAIWLGPLLERWLFAGNLMLWLDGQQGSARGGWVVVLFPFCALFFTLTVARWANPWLLRISGGWSRGRFAFVNLLKFLAATVVTLLLAEGAGALLSALGFDPRGSIVGTYVQRNALVVGFAMGFAIIPIIYTLAEDALSSVPKHLRSASLGAGATQWQTAMRVVVPTATSGLFSAVMVGLGRAVGETMIVLMAAGNVPIRDWNLFNGFQTLSAAIAVELPEASKDTTHYRTLFLAALCLFLLTFVVNTVAELVRIRYRRRAVQL